MHGSRSCTSSCELAGVFNIASTVTGGEKSGGPRGRPPKVAGLGENSARTLRVRGRPRPQYKTTAARLIRA